MKKQPYISVIMPCFNSKQYIRDAIESILHQSYTHFELIIIDDHSTDGTVDIIKDYQKRFSPFIRAVFLKKHQGDTVAANKGFGLSKGQYLARMDADDIAHPDRLAKQVYFLNSHPKVIVVGSQGIVINGQNKIIGEKKFPLTHKAIYAKFGLYNPMLHPSCMFRRSLLPNPKHLYSAKHTIHDDYYTFFSYLRYGEFANLPDYLLYYRIHGKNSSLKNPKKRFAQIQRIRAVAVKKLSYNMTKTTALKNLLQTCIVAILPEIAIVPLYMLSQGMYSPWIILKRHLPVFSSSHIVIAPEV